MFADAWGSFRRAGSPGSTAGKDARRYKLTKRHEPLPNSSRLALSHAPPVFQPLRARTWLYRARFVAQGTRTFRRRLCRVGQSDGVQAAAFSGEGEKHHLSLHGGRAVPTRTVRLQTEAPGIE